MPYINTEAKETVALSGAQTPGQLNYEITNVIMRYWWRTFKQDYTTINDIIGALEGAKLEFTRRIVVDFEKGKCASNGDVYQKPSYKQKHEST